ncbi:LacI family DNA-binding transcriptional regulator [Agrilactobacillus yilanensis]|uniref:LacI family DNA-binding transcriptional regulator n=1 Tax=Agrilactobacillus yilanensis TaxID=2485997 RepID=A0ABW4J4K2_9LACO|nr:LacI family DNA-binding transcriptional regulator [Agrilactobacillus yilanensis]
MRDIANDVGVSISTVSRTLSRPDAVDSETRRKILESIDKLGYTTNLLASGLKKGQTKTLGFVIPNLENLIYPTLATSVEQEAEKRGYFVIFCNTYEDLSIEAQYVKRLKGQAVDGFIFSTGLSDNASKTILELKKEHYPLVCLMRDIGDKKDSFVSENFEGGYAATKYLLDKGYRDIYTLTGRKELELYRQRTLGYKKALEDFGVKYKKDHVWNCARNGKEQAGNVISEKLHDGVIPEAIFSQSDPFAFDAIINLNQSGLRIPDNVGIIGFDDTYLSKNFDLTTMAQPLKELAVDATNHLIDMIEGKKKIGQSIPEYKVNLIVRGSV